MTVAIMSAVEEGGTSGAGIPGPPVGAPTQALLLTRRALDVIEALGEQRDAAALLYEGAVRVFADEQNPARVRLAALGMREAIEELEKDEGVTKGPGRMADRVRELRDKWERLCKRDDLVSEDGAKRLVKILKNFFTKLDSDNPKRRDRTEQALARRDPTLRPAPPAVAIARIERLRAFRKDFNGVLHGSGAMTVDAFGLLVERFEGFLLDWLRPLPAADLKALDALIEGGPPDG